VCTSISSRNGSDFPWQVSKLFANSSCIAITAFISPYRADRALARDLHEKADLDFIEVFVDAPLHVAEQRDPKGLYKKARAGEIKGIYVVQNDTSGPLTGTDPSEFTGISAPYEAPETPELHIRTDESDVTESVRMITEYLSNKGFI
jgi:adenylylsulfate kinase